MRIACDLDYTILSFPEYFCTFFESMQKDGHMVGILTARPHEFAKQNKAILKTLGITPDFFLDLTEEYQGMSAGMFKGIVCKERKIDVLFDDFQHSDPQNIADFFSVNTVTVPFTSWGFKNTVSGTT